MLDECLEFLENRSKNSDFKYEIIVVSDGSTDNTVKIAQEYVKSIGAEKLRVLELEMNRGKGGAVRLVRKENFKFNHKVTQIFIFFKMIL